MPEPPPTPLRLVLVDDHEMVLHGLDAMLRHFPDEVVIVGRTTTEAAALRAVAEQRPDIVLCDVRLGKASGLDLCRQITRGYPQTKVVLLTVYDDEHYLYQALRAGAVGYILKRVDGRELVAQLLRAGEGETVVDPALAGRVALAAARLEAGQFWPGAHLGLTQRESEVLGLLVSGHSNRAVAGKLVVSEDTVKTHIRGLYRKLGVSERSAAIAVALREGLFR
ncbi:response regulator [Nocardia asteroides]|uniref:Two-component response regulator n=1 Tax=Nocardia asteroides NBRC 15531 TaxID=1110697 RepID=U5E6S6_NOCAS|nr:response regulator transcription factor [Nocardia asteroides]UGT50279.1 response regulator transcription factor [Nocardia asteroides]GAD82006.1 putative two-component response regulator [Nocardia asteroides NBRC 15531]SFN13453.1 two component transcriptional regulator, LuxR family [Nocardia asteroides]VEG36939.1 Nitrogen regulation protein C [Nocardia asteroides]